MPIVFGSKLKSDVANVTFLDKTIDDITIGILGLNKAAVSGDEVVDVQLEINKARKVIFAEQTKLDAATITLDAISLNQEVRLSGSGAPVTLNVLPFTGVKVVSDGCEIRLVGHDDTFTVTFEFNDVQFGLLLNGNATLGKGQTLVLNYNDELERYIEIARNF